MTRKEYARGYWRNRCAKEIKPAYDELIKLYPFTTENLDGEIWLPIPKYENYHASNFGRIKSFKYGKAKILKPLLSSTGYLYVNLYPKKPKEFLIHRLVGQLFIPNPENKPQINHIYSRFSNFVDCLEWVTSKENMEHAVRNGLHKSGEDAGRAKLTNEQVLYIRENPDGLNQCQLAEKFGVHKSAIGFIQLGKSYKNEGGTIRQAQKRSIITDEMRVQILARYNAGGISQRALARQFSIVQASVSHIVNGRR